MSRHGCGTCRAPLHDEDMHSECKAHADAALTETSCSHCESMPLSSLRSRIAFFSEHGSAPHALPFPFSHEPRRKKRGQRAEQLEVSELTSAQTPRASLSPQKAISPVLFTRPDHSVDPKRIFTMTPCHWQLRMCGIGRAQWMTLPSCRLKNVATSELDCV